MLVQNANAAAVWDQNSSKTCQSQEEIQTSKIMNLFLMLTRIKAHTWGVVIIRIMSSRPGTFKGTLPQVGTTMWGPKSKCLVDGALY